MNELSIPLRIRVGELLGEVRMMRKRLIGECADIFKVRRRQMGYCIEDAKGNVLVYITFNRWSMPNAEVKIWSYWLDGGISLPKITPENASIAYSLLSRYFTPSLSMKILEVVRRIFKRWGA